VRANTATTKINATQTNIRKIIPALREINFSDIVPMDLPSSLTEARRERKSWTPPMKIEPNIAQSIAGNGPHHMNANIGPIMGPAPAIEEK